MSLVTLKEVLRESVERRYAVGAFDTASYQNTAAILKAAEQTGTPMILMVTWGMIEEQEKPGEYVKLTLEMIRNGEIYGTIAQRPVNGGYLSVKYMVDLLNGESIPERVDTGCVLVTKDNVDTYKDEA